jgi:glycosyltransferase involved in cell wall biosynthesis
VFNGFVDLEYAKTLDFKLKNGVEFLYAGALDSIRGIDLLPDLVNSLRQRLTSFSIYVTGSGPYEKEIKKWDLKEVVFLGFLNNAEYENILEKADVYLVLQKPDHPFSLGSFPSKIEYYSKYKKPIFKIDLN